ncbi:MAG: proline/glycine betaine ABC transporter permease [Bacteroidales bacterium]|jgi:glycine betaine/proline transport system permease protein|nr:proline/glycine betaine ABC transporter permease [Bacteroidales bacterium]
MKYLEIGKHVEKGIDWLAQNAEPFFDAITVVIEFLVGAFQDLLLMPHPFLMIAIISILAYMVSAGRKNFFTALGWKKGRFLGLFTLIGLTLLYLMNFWNETMQTIALVVSSAILALLIGIPVGIQTARSLRAEKIIRPILDFMQTMPAFVYLIPAILFFSVGNVPGVVATVVFALPPAVRLTSLGIRNVQSDVVEAAYAFGATEKQLLYKVQIPLALPSILAGVNQVIMLSLSMVVIASMVGAAGLGQDVYKSILTADLALGVESGLGIVIIAIILDRLTQAAGENTNRK